MLADITAQVERERRLRQSEAWLNAALTGIHDHAAVGLDAEGRIAHWSESAARMTGFARARGVHVDEVELVVHVDPPAEHKAYLHRSGRTARAGSAPLMNTDAALA